MKPQTLANARVFPLSDVSISDFGASFPAQSLKTEHSISMSRDYYGGASGVVD